MNESQKLQQWLLYTPLGRYVLWNERKFYSNVVQNLYGNYSLQIGLEQINLLQGNKIANHINIEQDIKTSLQFLPFMDNSINLIVCPHVLEFHSNYEHIIDEFYRVMSSNATLIITSFNDKYCFKPFAQKDIFKEIHSMINLNKLKTLLKNKGFYIKGGKFFSYCPPINKSKNFRNLKWLDKVGDRWFPTMAMNFGLIITKDKLAIKPNSQYQDLTDVILDTNLGTAKICKTK